MKKHLKTLLTSLFAFSVLTTPTVFAETPASPSAEQSTQIVLNAPLHLNRATASEIQKMLIGIGAKKAEAIVQYRETHGNFTAVEQLLEVQGIGKATLEKNRDRIVLD